MNARIQVGIRLRPFLESEVTKGYSNSKIAADTFGRRINVASAHGNNSQKVFEFDHIFEQSSQQSKVYADCDVTQLVSRVLDGFHSTIFAYGQTGSGKTYTMEGKHDGGVYQDTDQKGIAARALDDLFNQIQMLKMSSNKEFSVTCSFLQIYNERIYDLLGATPGFNGSSTTAAGPPSGVTGNPSGTQVSLPAGLKLRWTAREQFQVENLSIYTVKSAKEAQSYFLSGVKNRVTASHKLNMTSSRSHTIFTISVHTFSAEGAHETSAKLQLVDLAGSERISQTGTEGKLAKESIDINKSLFTLRQVITALSEINQASAGSSNGFSNNSLSGQDIYSTSDGSANHKLQHIPYRESKLTSLLKQSIGGNCYCLMIACIVPSDAFIDENVSTLHYASRATYIRNQPVKNEDPNKQLLVETKNENIQLKAELEKANAHIAFLTAALEKSEKLCAILKNNTKPNNESNQDQIVFMQQQEKFKQQQEIQEQQQKLLEEKIQQQRGNNNLPEMLQNQLGNTIEVKNNVPSSSNSPAGATPSGSNTTQQSYHGLPSGTTSQSFYSAADYDNFSDRLIESITLVRQLLQSNKELRQQTDESKQRMTNLQQELADLTRENQELREQLVYSKTASSQQFQTQIMSSKQWSTQNSVQRPPRPIDVAPRSLDATTSTNIHADLMMSANDWDKDRKNHFSVDDNTLPIDSKYHLNKRKNQDDDYDDICQIEPRLETNHSAAGYSFSQQQQQKIIASSTKNSRTENRKISRKELAQESGTMVSSHPRIKSQDITDRQGQTKLTSNQSSASKPRQYHVFYSASKKRINSLHQPKQSQQQQQQQYTSLQNQIDESTNFSGQLLVGASLNASRNNGGSLNTTNYMNQTLPESNYLNLQVQQQQQQQQWSSASINNNTGNIIPSIGGNAMDSAPTNFGRYTFYQQNFHNLEKLHSQQMAKIQQQGIAVNEICIPKVETQKLSGDIGIQRFNAGNNLILDPSKDSQLLELNTNHLKRGMILPQTTMAGSFKANRSNSLTKNSLNPSVNGNNNNNTTCFNNSVFPVTATNAGISINDSQTNGNSINLGYQQQQQKQFIFQQVTSSLPGNISKADETAIIKQRNDTNKIKQITRRQAASFSNSNDNMN